MNEAMMRHAAIDDEICCINMHHAKTHSHIEMQNKLVATNLCAI